MAEQLWECIYQHNYIRDRKNLCFRVLLLKLLSDVDEPLSVD